MEGVEGERKTRSARTNDLVPRILGNTSPGRVSRLVERPCWRKTPPGSAVC